MFNDEHRKPRPFTEISVCREARGTESRTELLKATGTESQRATAADVTAQRPTSYGFYFTKGIIELLALVSDDTLLEAEEEKGPALAATKTSKPTALEIARQGADGSETRLMRSAVTGDRGRTVTLVKGLLLSVQMTALLLSSQEQAVE